MSDANQASTTDFQDEIPEMIVRSQAAFARDLPELLKTHYFQWVAYHGDERIGFGRTQTELNMKCFRMGLKDDEFVVRMVDRQIADEEIVFGNSDWDTYV